MEWWLGKTVLLTKDFYEDNWEQYTVSTFNK